MSSNVRAGSSPAFSTLRDKSSFLDLSLFLFFRFTLLKWAILSKVRLISAVRTFLFSNWKFSGNIEPISLLLLSKSLLIYWFSILSSPFRPFLYNWKTSCFFSNCFSFSFSSFIRFWHLILAFDILLLVLLLLILLSR